MKTGIFIFWICIFLIIYSYLIYPIILRIIYKIKSTKKDPVITSYPFITILISAHNEEKFIQQKIESITKTTYPIKKIECLICSDSSTDNTDNIILECQKKYSFLKYYRNKKRCGKPETINLLVKKAKGKILILSDANVIFKENTISELVKHFEQKKIGLVDTNMNHIILDNKGIANQESFYIKYEKLNKYYEGKNWGCMIGPFGGCFAIRRSLYITVPNNILVDDLFICLKILEKGFDSIIALNSKVYETICSDETQEFKRKIRIASGGIQNLFYFIKLLNPFTKIGFCFVSHKVIRWLGPFLLILILISNYIILQLHTFYFILFTIQVTLIIIALLELFLNRKFHRNFAFKLASYFYQTNIAVLLGWYKFAFGIKSNIWNRTKRT